MGKGVFSDSNRGFSKQSQLYEKVCGFFATVSTEKGFLQRFSEGFLRRFSEKHQWRRVRGGRGGEGGGDVVVVIDGPRHSVAVAVAVGSSR